LEASLSKVDENHGDDPVFVGLNVGLDRHCMLAVFNTRNIYDLDFSGNQLIGLLPV
jgi:hypothetical protein